MRKKVLMGLGILVVALVIVACNPPSTPCPTCSPCPPTPTPCGSAQDARATIGAFETALAGCEATLTAIASQEPTCADSDTTCDGIDDDCDKEIDEDYQRHTCGLGVCQRSSECVNGEESCEPGPKLEAREQTCDNELDDDCDGLIDAKDDDCPVFVSCKEAKLHIGEFDTVQGIFYCSYRPDLGGQPTFCNCPVPYPDHDFTALIWGSERPIFESCLGGPPEILLDNREFAVSGLIEEYADKAQIILKECGQLTGLQ